MNAPLQTDRSIALGHRGLRLEYATHSWNVIGCWIVLASAYAARSVALAGFGIDSVIEIFASLVVIWQLKSINKDKEHLAEQMIGIALFLLAAYLAVQSAIVLLARVHPHTSPLGIVWPALTCAAMMALAYGKGKAGAQLGDPVLQKESKVTVVDGLLAGAVLIGLVLDAAFGLWWADPLAALLIMYYGVREGLDAIQG
ncbi:MAG TPA: cation transporter [Chloroflexota bacterium]